MAFLIAFAAIGLGLLCLILAVRAYRRADRYRRLAAWLKRDNWALRAALDRANEANGDFTEWTDAAGVDVCALADGLQLNDPIEEDQA